jgi:sugar phosphate isomerase/epimerase
VRYAVCNELFGELSLGKAASIAAEKGFHGLELAPFTVFGDFSAAAIRIGITDAKRVFAQTGLVFAGLHWLLARPDGLRITTSDTALRRKSWDHLRRLIDAAAELGGGKLVLGSPRQRGSEAGQSRAQATAILADELAAIAPYAAERGSPILIEALDASQTDVVNLMAESAAIVGRIGHPGVSSMFDFHNCADETDSYATLVEKHFHMIEHVHLNDVDGGHPRPGHRAYLPAFAKLAELGYKRWVSLEIFTTPEDPARVLGETMAYLKEVETAIRSS